jgi:hypothetical protein
MQKNDVERISLNTIKVPKGGRPLDEEQVQELAGSIQQLGLLNPILLTLDHTLVAGRRRLAACKLLGKTDIACSIRDLDGIKGELAEIDENLIRGELTQLERSDHLLRRDELLEQLGLRRQAGRYPKSDQPSTPDLVTTKKLAAHAGISERGVRQAKQISRGIIIEAKDKLRHHPVANKTTELLALAKLDGGNQKKVAKLLVDGDAKTVKEAVKQQKKKEMLAKAVKVADPGDNQGILDGDMKVLFEELSDNSVDMFLTDPPYDNPKAFEELARLAQAKLKPGGLCVTYSGQYYLPEILSLMGKHLEYWWVIALVQASSHCQVWPRRVNNAWKPILIYSKPPHRTDRDMLSDVLTGRGCDKRYHQWGQDAGEAVYLLEKLTAPGDLIVDPFVGGGAIPAACKGTGRPWLGTEINEETGLLARQRLRELTPEIRKEKTPIQ